MALIYVFGKKDVDVDDATQKLVQALKEGGDLPQRVVFRHDVAYTHLAGTVHPLK